MFARFTRKMLVSLLIVIRWAPGYKPVVAARRVLSLRRNSDEAVSSVGIATIAGMQSTHACSLAMTLVCMFHSQNTWFIDCHEMGSRAVMECASRACAFTVIKLKHGFSTPKERNNIG